MPAVTASKYLVMAGWDDVPHLSDKTKKELLDSTPPHLRAARSRGIPVLGDGLVFPVDEVQWVIDPFPIPDHWVRIGGMDFGWDHPWAMVDCAWDRDEDVFYVVRDARQRTCTPKQAMVMYGDSWPVKWLPFSWPHDGLQHDKGSGEQLKEQYKEAGFKMLDERATFPDETNGVEAGIMQMLERKQARKWRVFKSCSLYIGEARMYHRKDGLIVKIGDDVISAARYAYMMRRYAVRPAGTAKKLVIPRSWKAA